MAVDQAEPWGKRRLEVDLEELETAFESASWEIHHYLDLETGEVLLVTDETRCELEAIYEEVFDEEGNEVLPFAEALERRKLPGWMKEAIKEADRVETGFGSRCVEVPQIDSRDAYRTMEDFIDTVQDERLQNRLWRAIQGRGAFRYFKDVLSDYPRERERWFEFRDARVRQEVLDWLEAQGIEPIVE